MENQLDKSWEEAANKWCSCPKSCLEGVSAFQQQAIKSLEELSKGSRIIREAIEIIKNIKED